ncbi:hypothetical protein V5799_008983 [Amblyomma americanum]|uniref:Peptidase M13 N-terminal domain-containing protein n=1 Tax=Amblyomma americanum TaxID=6943 RepID=A0AAQ4FCU0_AMBAM
MDSLTIARRKVHPIFFTVASCLATAFVIGIVFIVIGIGPRPARTQSKDQSGFCCPKLLDPLAPMVNLTLDPCQEPFLYVCYYWKSQSSDSTLRGLEGQAFASVLQGTEQSEAGRALHRIYMSCISTLASTEPIQFTVVRGLLEVISSPVVAPYSFEDNLRLVLTLSLSCRVFLPVSISAEWQGKKYMLRFWSQNSSIAPFLSGDYEATKRDGLEYLLTVLNDLGIFNLSMTDVSTIVMNFERKRQAEPKVSGNLRLLELLVPQGSAPTFKSVLDKIHSFPANNTAVDIDSFETIRSILSFLTTPANQPMAVSYAIFEAAVWLYKDTLHWSGLKPAPLLQHCVTYVKHFRMLIFAFYAERLSDPVKDLQARATVNSIKTTVIEKLSLLGEGIDRVSVSSYITRLELVLPAQLVAFIKRLPDVSGNMFSNILLREAWLLKVRLSVLNLRMAVTNILNRRTFDEYVQVTSGYIFIAPITLGLVGTTNPDAQFERSAAIGPLVADALWTLVLENTTWSAKAEEKLDRLRKCASDRSDHSLRYPVLSLQTAAWSARQDTWHKSFLVWSLWTASISQVFYLRYIHFAACLRVITRVSTEEEAITNVAFVNSTPDFRDAFNCPPPVDEDGESCAQQMRSLGWH